MHHLIYNSMFQVQNTKLSDIRVEEKKGGRKGLEPADF